MPLYGNSDETGYNEPMETSGFFVGRFNPIHAGHERVIDHMLDSCGPANSTVVIGSSNAPTSMRHFFSYSERRGLIKQLYPDIRVIGLPDFENDDDWLLAMDDLVSGVDGQHEPLFFGGSEEDVRFFTAAGRAVKILNRFDGTTPKVSASEVRDSLLHKRPLDGLLNPAISEFVVGLFWERWEEFKKT